MSLISKVFGGIFGLDFNAMLPALRITTAQKLNEQEIKKKAQDEVIEWSNSPILKYMD
jgi:hypothetical protein